MGKRARLAAGLLLVPATLSAQAPAIDVPAAMQQMAAAVTALQKSVDQGQRAAYAEPLQTLTASLKILRGGELGLPSMATAEAAMLGIDEAVNDFANPIADGANSDTFDLQRLRRGCTSCHLATRDRNEERGLFPNQHAAVAGRLRLTGQDGAEREDRGGLVVFLERIEAGSPSTPVAPLLRAPAISQRGRQFHPAVLAVTTGTVVRFPNDDVVFHNVFSLSRNNAFDLGTYAKGQGKEHTLTMPGLVKVHCNIHPDMVAHVLVLNTALSAVTTADGHWLIPDVPHGDYTLRVWHSLADEQRLPIHVDDDGINMVPLAVTESKPRVSHPNKYGRAYPTKY